MIMIKLTKPLTFGETTTTELILRRPTAGDLRGIKMQAIGELEVDTVLKLAQRLSTTPLAPTTLDDLDPADLLVLGAEIAGFFATSPSFSPKMH